MKSILSVTLALAIIASGSNTASAVSDDFTSSQKEAMIATIRDALVHDPSILRDAIASLRAADAADRTIAAHTGIEHNQDALYHNSADPLKGNSAGKLVVVEFFDPRCSYCKALQPRMNDALKANPDVKLVLKDYPILGPNSILASRALLAAQKQDKYDVLQEALMELKEDPNEQVLQRVATSVSLDWTRLRSDMDDPEIQKRLQANVVLGQQLRVQGTPAMIIGNQLVPGAIDPDTLNRLLAQARKAAEPQSSHS